MIFRDRRDAGRALAHALRNVAGLEGAVALALPRGGVPVGYEIARALQLPLDVLVVRKLGAPGQQELALGAVSGSGVLALNEEIVRAFGFSMEQMEAMAARERAEIARREDAYRQGRAALDVKGRTVLVVDDGLATGSTMMAAVRTLRPVAARVVVAVPVGARKACEELREVADKVICLEAPEHFQAVGEFYEDFGQTSDAEVRELLAAADRQGK